MVVFEVVLVEDEFVVGTSVIDEIVALTQILLLRMKGNEHSVHVFPSALHFAQKRFLNEQGLHMPLPTKNPSPH